jgi:hypothetical protein
MSSAHRHVHTSLVEVFGALKLTYEEIVQKGTGFRIRPG